MFFWCLHNAYIIFEPNRDEHVTDFERSGVRRSDWLDWTVCLPEAEKGLKWSWLPPANLDHETRGP